MRKIVLIEPQSKDDHVYKHVFMPRLGLPIIGTQLQQEGYQVDFYLGTMESLPWAKILEADLVGLSTTTATCREAYRISGLLRSNDVPVVIGGIHASFLPDEALNFADYLVRGEAETTIIPLIKALEEARDPDDIPGVSFWKKSKPVHNPPQQSAIKMDTLPIPDLSIMKNASRMLSTPVMTSRGCPYNCSFCCVTKMFGHRYRYRCTESVLEELAQYPGKHIFFCDDNFAANSKRSKELMREMIERPEIKIKGWGAQLRADASYDDELLDLMSRSGCSIVYIGFESINPETLKGYNKEQNVEDVKSAIYRFHEYGIRIHGMFVFGGEGDKVETIRETTDFAVETKIDSVQFMMLTPMPGTPFYEQLEKEGRIINYDWSLYDGHYAVFKPSLMTPLELQQETVKAHKKFYSPGNIFKNVAITGWASALYRAIGYGLARHFAYQSRWYNQYLKNYIYNNKRPVTLFYRQLGVTGAKNVSSEVTSSSLKVSLIEKRGILYLKIKGIADNLQLKELNRTIRKNIPKHYSQLVVNTEGLRFSSEKAASSFAASLERLGTRMRRLQVTTKAKRQARHLLNWGSKRRLKLPRFEILLHKD